ncbi:hypothetical protein [Paenibacillus donghaensis]|uniref:Uncharacterized protein n=1 Tax=Paenibacillus donghaensis TaxID=414771 RepID=A0A2Z2KIK8_9BACL|nr:hypothetical protein [Paenibacillus donghaensis]ASA19651.1 hypothetical protein B9T62_01735 [Paenibacillus donghaensis]
MVSPSSQNYYAVQTRRYRPSRDGTPVFFEYGENFNKEQGQLNNRPCSLFVILMQAASKL